MNLAIFGGHVEYAHLLAPATAIGIHTHDDMSARLKRLAAQTIDKRLGNREAFAFYQRRLTIRVCGLDGQVHVRVHPVEARHSAFKQQLLRRIEHGLAVVGTCNSTKERGRGKRKQCGVEMFHV